MLPSQAWWWNNLKFIYNRRSTYKKHIATKNAANNFTFKTNGYSTIFKSKYGNLLLKSQYHSLERRIVPAKNTTTDFRIFARNLHCLYRTTAKLRNPPNFSGSIISRAVLQTRCCPGQLLPLWTAKIRYRPNTFHKIRQLVLIDSPDYWELLEMDKFRFLLLWPILCLMCT